MALLPVAEAQARLLALLSPIYREEIPLGEAVDRVLDGDLAAKRTSPPHDLSAMDGFAVRSADCADIPATLKIIEGVPAGIMPTRTLGPGEATRLFTGSVAPEGADAIVIQENTTYTDETVTVNEAPRSGQHIRKAGMDFREGDVLMQAGTRLSHRHIALAAAMNQPVLNLFAKPTVAIVSTGSELVPPGADPGPGQIIASNGVALAAAVQCWGGHVDDKGIVADDFEALKHTLFRSCAADLIVTSGGASVGDHDLVQQVILDLDGTIDFWRIAMKPGKPLMVGTLGRAVVIGLPGNPVSALVCAELFLKPALAALTGQPNPIPSPLKGRLTGALPATTTRQEYVRAAREIRDGEVWLTPTANQDSSALAALAVADALIVRPPESPESGQGTAVDYLPLD